MDLFTLETIGLAGTFEELSAGFRWQVPARFNLAWDCCGRHAVTRERFALYFEDGEGTTAAFFLLGHPAGLVLVQGPHRRHDQRRGVTARRPGGDRELPAQAYGRHNAAVIGVPDPRAWRG
jgi:hypothetical protein